jgi:hypothetical protein
MSSLFPTRWKYDKPPSLEAFTRRFRDDYACAEYLAERRWPDGFVCPHCGHRKGWRLESRPWVWECANPKHKPGGCGRQTSVISGTVMHGTRVPLRTWFLAAYLVATHSNGISALQLQPKLGLGSYKTAWLLLHKLRRAMVNPDREPLSGTVEIDETNIPFRTRDESPEGGQGKSKVGKIMMVGAVELVDRFTPGRMRLERIEQSDRENLMPFVLANTVAGSHVVTDGNTAYEGMPDRKHTAINMSAPNALPAHIYMPWIHRIFANFKRWGLGTYHGFRDKHIDAYANEFTFRWNRRRRYSVSIDALLGIGQNVGRITYRDIVGDTLEWRHLHKDEVLAMVRPDRLRAAKAMARYERRDIFVVLDEMRAAEERRDYPRKNPLRPALPPRRPGEKRRTGRYRHPPRIPKEELAQGYLRHIPPGSIITLA